MSDFDLDHVGIAVHDLDAAAERYRRLGFRLTPRGYHTTPPATPGGPRPRAGTGNNCAMLARGYIELIGVTDPSYAGRLRADLDRYEGLHIVAFGTPDAQAASRSLRDRGIAASEPRILERPIEDSGREELARFDIVDFPPDLVPELYSFAIQHRTRHLLWKPELLQHPNGATGLQAITVAVADPRAFAERLAGVLGAEVERGEGEGTLSLRLTAGAVHVTDARTLAATFPAASVAPPFVAGMTLATGDLGATEAFLKGNGVELERRGDSLVVTAAAACGAFIGFVAG